MIEDAKSSQKNWQYLFPKDDASSLQPHQSPTGIPAILEERPTGIPAILEEKGSDRVDTMVRYVHGIWHLGFSYMNQTFCLCLLIGSACQWYIQACWSAPSTFTFTPTNALRECPYPDEEYHLVKVIFIVLVSPMC